MTENVVCMACGAEVRSEALFCYACGRAVAAIPVPEDDVDAREESGVDVTATAPVQKPDESDSSTLASQPEPPTQVGAPRKPLTAAMMRRKRASNRQPVEVVWEEPQRSSMLFVILSIVLAAVSAIILVAAMYLK